MHWGKSQFPYAQCCTSTRLMTLTDPKAETRYIEASVAVGVEA
jgi:hypothetical protein